MHALKRRWIYLPVAALLAAAACTNDALDDGNGPDVALEIITLNNLPVTAQTAAGGGGGCTVTVVPWTGTAQNNPLNAQATTSPFNDIVLESVTITYEWINGVAATPVRIVGLGDVRISAGGGQNLFSFHPIAFQDLTPSTFGSTANLTLLFTARTVENETIRFIALRQLFVQSCPAP